MTTLASESRAYQRDDGLWVFPRDEFARERFTYKPGEHVVFGGPSQLSGKTTLGFKLLEYTATPDLPALVSVSKPKDKVTASEGARLGFRRTSEYPVPPKIREMWEGKPSGYLIWPDMSNPDTAMVNAERSTRAVIRQAYSDGAKNKQSILVLDDTVTKSKALMLDRDMILILTMSGAMGVGGWFFVQKPTDAGKTALWSYPNANHVFLARDTVKSSLVAYNNIGGHDGTIVAHAIKGLKQYQFLYLERGHGYMCVVDSK